MPEFDQAAFFEEHFETLDPCAEPGTAGARALLKWLSGDRATGARLLWCRAQAEHGREIVAVELEVPLGQRPPVAPIERYEPVAFLFRDGGVPAAFPLRPGFPLDLPHINLAPEDVPRSLCLFELDPDEVLRLLSPVMLVERTKWWLGETAYGRLHGDDQPLDPVFGGRTVPLVFLSPEALADKGHVVAGIRETDDLAPILVDREARFQRAGIAPVRFSVVSVTTAGIAHGRIRAMPRTAGQLIDAYADLGIDLVAVLRDHFHGWRDQGEALRRLKDLGILVLATPIHNGRGDVAAVSRRAFLLAQPLNDLVRAVGAIIGEGSTVGWAIGPVEADRAALDEIRLEPASVHCAFDRSLAAMASGTAQPDRPARILQAGCGALGSQIALAATRSGVGTWTFIDPDYLLPHNLARHALSPHDLGMAKAHAMAGAINALLGDSVASGHRATIQEYLTDRSDARDFDLVFDASASVVVARALATSDAITEPVASTFLSPSGADLVVMREGPGRSIRLDHLEMDYYWQLVVNPALRDHLRAGVGFIPAGGCRQLSARIAQADVMRAAADATLRIFDGPGIAPGTIEIVRSSGDARTTTRIAGGRYREVSMAGWTIAVSEELLAQVRVARLRTAPNETGGILVGAWDRQLRKGYLVAALDPPSDSLAGEDGFVRGAVGVFHTLQAIGQATAQNLDYIGEWHSHPPLSASTPSDDDAVLMTWIEDVTASDVPALMVIAGADGVRICAGTTSDCVVLDVGGDRAAAEKDACDGD